MKNKKGPLGQDASHMGNPLKAFRDAGEKRIAAYRNGGYNTPKGHLPKRFLGGDPPMILQPTTPVTTSSVIQGPLTEESSVYLNKKYPMAESKATRSDVGGLKYDDIQNQKKDKIEAEAVIRNNQSLFTPSNQSYSDYINERKTKLGISPKKKGGVVKLKNKK